MGPPLSTLLSQVLVAHTIELDNEFERRFVDAGGGARVASVAVWSTLLRFVGRGAAVRELVEAAGVQRPRTLSLLGGLERWRYVTIESPGVRSAGKPRDGSGSARGVKDDSVVRLTAAGERAAAIWADLGASTATAWGERFGVRRISGLERALRDVVDPLETALPAYVPILFGSRGLALDLPVREEPAPSIEPTLLVLLARAAMRYGLEFESESPVSLALAANVVRVLDEDALGAAEIARRAGISNEAAAIGVTALRKTQYVVVDGPTRGKAAIRLTEAGRLLRSAHDDLHRAIEARWTKEHGEASVGRLRKALDELLGDAALPEGLRPPPSGWRAGKAYRARTDALLADPRTYLPHAPMVLPRGGWPDGS